MTNGGFDSDTAWTKGADWTISGGTANYNNAGAAQVLSQAFAMTAGRAYVVVYTVSALSSGFIYPRLQGSSNVSGVTATANGTYKDIIFAPASPTAIGFVAQGIFSIDNISVRELPGNHALAPNDASRPVLRARYNLLERSEEFDNAYWSKTRTSISVDAAVAPDGTTTADKLVENTDTNTHFVARSFSAVSTTQAYTFSVYAKAAERSTIWLTHANFTDISFDLINGTCDVGGVIQNVGNGWFRCSVTATAPDTVSRAYAYRTGIPAQSYTGDGTSGLFLWGADLKTAADQSATGGAYQRIAAATDYDTSNPVWRPYLAFDGTDDFFNLASAISITTDMTVVRGFGRSAAGIRSGGLASTALTPNTGIWFSDNATYLALGGSQTTSGVARTQTGFFVDTARRNVTTQTVRRNGTEIETLSAPSVAGTLTTLGLVNVHYNQGPIYGLIVLDRELTGSELTATEQWMAGKTGVTL